MNKFLKAAAAVALTTSLVACSNNSSTAEPTPAPTEETKEEVAEVELAKASYTVTNATGESVKELYLVDNAGSDKGKNYAEGGLADGETVEIDLGEIDKSLSFTLDFTTEGGYNGKFETLHVEEAPIWLLNKDDMTGATMISFTEPEEKGAAGEASVKVAAKYGAAHGTKCFSSAVVVVNAADGTIVDAFLDEYQFMNAEGNTGVPNSDATADGDFATNYPEGKVLGSKKANHEAYSAHMKEAAGATTDIKDSYEAIEAFVAGKAAADLADVDEVTGSTLADTANYVKLIAETAELAMASENEYAVSDASAVEIRQAEYAAHGTKCFTLSSAVVEGDKIVAAYIDEFQYMDAEGNTGVPNSDATADGDFATNYPEGKVLGSKKDNHEAYSAHMKEAAGATTDIKASYEAIEAFIAGKTAADLADVDAVTGSTLADTANYVKSVVNAVENSK